MSDTIDATFVVELLRSVQADLSELKRGQTNIELRLTANEHMLQGFLAHVAAIHSSMDDVKADMRLVKRRLDLVDA